jgi:hypothetical protein
MGLSRKAIDEFKEICRDEFGANLSDTEAEQRALEVLEVLWLLSLGGSGTKADHLDGSKPEPVP